MARRRNSNRRRRRGSFGFLYKLLSTLVICAAVVAALTLFFRVEWGELKREAALTQLARLERLFPLYDCGLGDVTAAALLMESNRSASEQMEQTEVTSGTVVLRACIVH